MADFMHCNSCYKQPQAQGDPTYFLTSCYHIICERCLREETSNPTLCAVCKHEMKTIEINSAMNPKLRDLFKPPKKLIEEKITVLKKKYDFQQMLINSLLNHLKKQREKLEQLMRYCQEQAKITKDNAKEMAELKEWVATAEFKMKENEQEKACLLKEIEDLKKLTRRYERDGGYETTIDKIFLGAGDNCNNETTATNVSITGDYETADEAPPTTPFLHAPPTMGINDTLGSIACITTSPQPSVDSSVVSEMTTPKMLGLPKKGLATTGGSSHPTRRTPSGIDAQNPYAEVFSRSSSIQRCATRTPPSKTNVFAGVRHSIPRFPSKLPTASGQSSSKSPTISGYVTKGSIIPRVNTPSVMGRNNL